jgi:hypothetical protein
MSSFRTSLRTDGFITPYPCHRAAEVILPATVLSAQWNTWHPRSLKARDTTRAWTGGARGESTWGCCPFCPYPRYLLEASIKTIPGCLIPTSTAISIIRVLLFEMLCGLPPFRAKSRNQLQQLITTGKPKYPKFLSSDALSILKVRDALGWHNPFGFHGCRPPLAFMPQL